MKKIFYSNTQVLLNIPARLKTILPPGCWVSKPGGACSCCTKLCSNVHTIAGACSLECECIAIL